MNYEETYRNFDEEYKKLYAAAQTAMTAAYFEDHPTDPEKVILRKPPLDQGADYERGFVDGMQYQMQSSVDKAVNRMAQTQEPKIGCVNHDCDKCKAQTQEPVAWLEPEWGEEICPEVGFEATTTSDHPRDLCWIPLYPHPPQRTWVGLTDEEIDVLHMEVKVRLMGTFDTKDIYRVVEAKLKEKNCL
jgi:hypothetical protein